MKRPPDMTAAQFNAALKRRGWSKVLFWIHIPTLTGSRGVGVIVNRRTGKIMRRATLAHAIREAEAGR